MTKILLIDGDLQFSELARLSLEEQIGAEVIIATTENEAISIIKKEAPISLIISDYQEGVLAFLISDKSTVPFFYLTDEKRIEIPFTPTMFVGVFRRSQFKQLCESAIHLLKRRKPKS